MASDFTLPTFLEDQTEDVIRQRMLGRLPDNLDKTEGSMPYDTIEPVAIELTLAAVWASELLKRGFTKTTYDEYLDLKAEESGLIRRSSVAAQTPGDDILFKGKEGSTVPAGYEITTESTDTFPALSFQTLADVTLDSNGEGYVAAEAITPGLQGNVPIDSIIHLSDPIDGITSVTNTAATKGGLDQEDDDTLRDRIFEEDQKEEGDGNVADYISWAKLVSGVGNVLVDPLWQGEGTVRVIVLDPTGRVAPQSTVDAVQTELDPGITGTGQGKAPVGSKTTVTTADIRSVNATIPNLEASAGYTIDQAQTNATAALNQYLFTVNPGGVIKVREAEASIINATGISNIGDVTLDGARDDIILDVTELAQIGDVTFS